jgi:hypothetical protein
MAPKKRAASARNDGMTGTYVYDKSLGAVVLVSRSIPKVASKGRASAPADCRRACEGPRRGGCGGGCAA